MTACARRSGATLAELAVALVITGVAGLMGVGLLAVAERRAHRDAMTDRGSQAARDAAHVLGPEITGADPTLVSVRGDTALDLGASIGVSVACVVSGSVVVIPGDRSSMGDPFTRWRAVPERGDIAIVWDTLATVWQRATIDTAAFVPDGAGCPAGGPFRSAADSLARVPAMRMRLAVPLAPTIGPGAPLRVLREVRWTLYRSADRQWWLGLRRCPGGACGTAQPVAGPFAAPTDSGLVFRRGTRGTVSVTVRAPRDASSAGLLTTRVWAVRGAPDGGT